jgi:P-type Cu+ transporter
MNPSAQEELEEPAELGVKSKCHHCGQSCEDVFVEANRNRFCCQGCKTVYEILHDNNLCEYYSLDQSPGISLRHVREENFAYLDEPEISKKVLNFSLDDFSRVQFSVPGIHCVSCIWLLENLKQLNPGIARSEVNFGRKQLTIDFNPHRISLAGTARLLASLGYSPYISLQQQKPGSTLNQSLIIRLAVAGFCFGNIMLLSFPEYLGLGRSDLQLQTLFSYLNLLLSIPVVLFSGQDYFLAAWRSFRQKQINIDVPIAAGLAALFLRSAFDILTHHGPGYLDSLAGLVFFLLIGRWFQSKTYDSLAFDRDYKSYFPLAANRNVLGQWIPVLVHNLEKGDLIRVNNMEIIPADSYVRSQEAYIDYSFVTGESRPVHVQDGEFIYGGGRLIGRPAEFIVEKKMEQSHLTSLWNHETFHKNKESRYKKTLDKAAQKFTWVVLALAVVTAIYWYTISPAQMWLVVTSVLMVACPCALALAAPFTFGNMLRVFGRSGFYLKNADVIERLAAINSVVFDKTGTVTQGAVEIKFVGQLSSEEVNWVKQLASSSSHPLSRVISNSISSKSSVSVSISAFEELPSQGINAIMDGHQIKIGSASFTGFTGISEDSNSKVFVSIDGHVRGYFNIETAVRKGLMDLISQLKRHMPVFLLSGDNASEKERMKLIFTDGAELHFNQTPLDKLHFISNLQQNGYHVIMVGDGLNDSGALNQSDIGIAVTDDTGIFTPASDAILQGDQLHHLDQYLRLSRKCISILQMAFGVSFLYNFITLSFAVTGNLSPLIAAILMPVSSICVVGFSTLAVNWVSKGVLKNNE